MEINVKLDKNFTIAYNKLQKKYGEEMAKINGFAPSQLSYTDFIDNFVDSNTVADASVDGNANVGQKDIVTLIKEMPKPHQKVLAFNKIFYELNKKYGLKVANEWLEAEWNGHLYMHDANTSSFFSYCFAYDLKDLAEKGLFFIENFNAEPPKHLTTFIDFVKEFTNYSANRTAGACGFPNLIPYLYYFWDRDVKNGYYTKTPRDYAIQGIQRLIYSLNQPYTRDGIQSAFTNTSIFDHPYLEALFGGAEFPDGKFMIDEIEEIMEFQKLFLEVMSDIRSKNMMTFPVNSISLLRQNGKFVDEEFARYACEHNRKWNDSNLFVDDSVTSLSNCCFDGKQQVLVRSNKRVILTSFEELYNLKKLKGEKSFIVFHNGNWVGGKIIRLPKRPMYKITTSNKKELYVTDNHIFPTFDGDKTVSSLTTNDYLLFNARKLSSYPEQDKKLTYEQGYLIGMYLGDGSTYKSKKSETSTPTVHLSLNEYKYNSSLEILERALFDIDKDVKLHLQKPHNNVYPVVIRNWPVFNFIKEYVLGDYSSEKELNMDCLFQGYDFRRGILDGYYKTDGGNSNRIYTTSEKLVHQIECLTTSLGLNNVIDVTDRTNEPVIIRGESYKRNHPLYCIRWYSPKNKRKNAQIGFKVKNNCEYFKITSIEPYDYNKEFVYCFEMDNFEEPYFTLPNGVITHNCRLKSNIKDLGYFNSVGGTALKVGSVKVSTINLARLALENKTEEEYLAALEYYTNLNLKALDCVRNIIKRNVEKGLLKNFTYGLIDFEHLYNTIGFLGCYETIKSFGYITEDEFNNTYYTQQAEDFGKKIFDTIHKVKAEFAENVDYQINCEQIPGESAAAKLMKKDKLIFPETVIDDLPLYGNQFIPLGIKTTLQERIRIASLFDSFCNGGSILHVNIEAPFNTPEQAWKMLNYVAEQGVTYFAFNTKIQACDKNHAFYGKKCPVCGGGVATEYTRIVGFYTPIRTYSKERKEEYSMREWEDVNI